jgi:hypothetical protein
MTIDQTGTSLLVLAGGVAGRTVGVAVRLGVGVGVLGVGVGVAAVELLAGAVGEPVGVVGEPVGVRVGRGEDGCSDGEDGGAVGVESAAELVSCGDGVGAAATAIPTVIVSARPASTVPSTARIRITGPSNTTRKTPGMGVGLLPV